MTLILWLLGILGIGGTVALFIFAPAVASALMQAAMKLLGAMLQTRIGVGILVGLAAICAGELHGRHVANQACHEADVRAEKEALARDLAITKQAADDATQRAASIEASAKTNEDRVHELETALAAKPVATQCRASATDLRRLRAIR